MAFALNTRTGPKRLYEAFSTLELGMDCYPKAVTGQTDNAGWRLLMYRNDLRKTLKRSFVIFVTAMGDMKLKTYERVYQMQQPLRRSSSLIPPKQARH